MLRFRVGAFSVSVENRAVFCPYGRETHSAALLWFGGSPAAVFTTHTHTHIQRNNRPQLRPMEPAGQGWSCPGVKLGRNELEQRSGVMQDSILLQILTLSEPKGILLGSLFSTGLEI